MIASRLGVAVWGFSLGLSVGYLQEAEMINITY